MSPDETLPVTSPAPVDDAGRRTPILGRRSTGGFIGGERLPPIGLLLARPFVLGLCALLGALGGYLFTAGDRESSATATIVFAVASTSNRDSVAMEGATLQRTIAPPWVLQRAATSLGEDPTDYERLTTVAWQEGTRLLNVTAVAPNADQAVNRANAIANATVQASDEARNNRLNAAVQEANALLSEAPLEDPDAETARRNQIGASLGDRQNEIQRESMSLIVITPATEAQPVGLSKTKGGLVGLAAGLFIGAIIAVLMGARGMRVPKAAAMQRLTPNIDALSPSDLPRIAGQLVEAKETVVVVVATRGASESAQAISRDLQRLLAAQGTLAEIATPDTSEDQSSIAMLLADASQTAASGRRSNQSRADADLVLLNVEAGTEMASMLEGRDGFTTVVVVSPRKTPLANALDVYRSFARSRSFLMVASKSIASR